MGWVGAVFRARHNGAVCGLDGTGCVGVLVGLSVGVWVLPLSLYL